MVVFFFLHSTARFCLIVGGDMWKEGCLCMPFLIKSILMALNIFLKLSITQLVLQDICKCNGFFL